MHLIKKKNIFKDIVNVLEMLRNRKKVTITPIGQSSFL